MTTNIDGLVDDCLLHIFDYLDVVNWVSIAQVCTRWKRIVENLLKKIRKIQLKDAMFCPHRVSDFDFDDDDYDFDNESIDVNADTIKNVLQYCGPHLRSVVLGNCIKNVIIVSGHYHHFNYRITDDFCPDEFILRLSQTSINIEELQIESPYVNGRSFHELLQSNKQLKRVLLPDANLSSTHAKCDSVEQVTFNVSNRSRLYNFEQLFPNVKDLTLYILNRFVYDGPDNLLDSILHRVKHIKSLTIVSEIHFLDLYFMNILSNISILSQIEDLRIYNSKSIGRLNMEFKAGSVEEMIQSCQNLRIFCSNINIGTVDVASFLSLPKLEHLGITGAKFFSSKFINTTESRQFEQLGKLRIKFVNDESLDLSGLSDAVKKMPVLKYLKVDGLSEEKTYELTCRVIASCVIDNDVIVQSNNEKLFETIRVYKNGNPQRSPKPLRLVFGSQGKDYGNKVFKYVQTLLGCSIIDGEKNHFYGYCYVLGIYPQCGCTSYMIDNSDEEESTSEED